MSSEWDSRPGDFFRFVEEYKSLSGTAQQAKWQGLNDQQRDYLKTTYGLQAPSAVKIPRYSKKKKIWIGIGIFVGLVLIAGLTEDKEETESSAGLAFEVLSDEVQDTPIKTMIVQNILVDGEVTPDSLSDLLYSRYEEAMDRTGFEYRAKPNDFRGYVWTTREHWRGSHGMWIAALEQNPTQTEPSVTIKTDVLLALAKPAGEKWGLSEENRIKLFHQIVRAEWRASQEAEETHPDATTRKEIMAEIDLQVALREKYEKEVLLETEVPVEEMGDLVGEALRRNWPWPVKPIEQTQNDAAKEPAEYQLAVINASGYVSKEDSSVLRFRYLLDQLTSKTSNSEQEIGDMTVAAHQMLTEKGKEITLLNLMEAANESIPNNDLGLKYEEVIAVLLTMLGG